MKCLIVLAHPLHDSLCYYLAQETIAHMKNKGYDLSVKDLYKENFEPALRAQERASYYAEMVIDECLQKDIAQLQETESLVLIFPTWWFSFPAILKGWFDRVWAPGYAYHHASNFGPITPNLTNLKELKVITTLGAPWWVDFFILQKPVKKVLKLALLGVCARKATFRMLSLYNSEKLDDLKIQTFVEKIKTTF